MTTATHPYIESLLTGTRELPRTKHAWLNERRGAALERANELSVPTTRDEDWRFTDLAPLTKLTFTPATSAGAISADVLESHRMPEAGARIVFVDGIFVPSLSDLHGDPCCGDVQPLAQHLQGDGAMLEGYLARLAGFDQDVFAALNTAHLRDGAVVVIPQNRACEKPVHILHVSTQAGTVAYPRCLVIAEQGADCTIVEEHVALGENAYLTNAVTEVSVGPNARIRHIKLQREAKTAFHIAACAVSVGRDASYVSQAIALGARLSRYELNVALNAQGANAEVDGLALISGRQLADTHSMLDHAQPNCRSRQLHKTIVDGGAHAVFNGKIFVRPDAQQTDSAQESRNLLLSPKAQVDAKPQLEIFADDVKCAHGATVGQLDREQLFYLRSRGLPEAVARNLLTYAFGAAVIQRVPVPSVVSRLEREVMAQTHAPV